MLEHKWLEFMSVSQLPPPVCCMLHQVDRINDFYHSKRSMGREGGREKGAKKGEMTKMNKWTKENQKNSL